MGGRMGVPRQGALHLQVPSCTSRPQKRWSHVPLPVFFPLPQLNRLVASEREARAAVESEKRLVLIELEAKQARLADMMTAAQVGRSMSCCVGSMGRCAAKRGSSRVHDFRPLLTQARLARPPAPPRSAKPRRRSRFGRTPTGGTAS